MFLDLGCQEPSVEKEKRKTAKEDSEEPEEILLAKNKHRTLNVSQKKTLLVGPKERKARKAEQRVVTDFRSVIFALNLFTKVQAEISRRTEAREKSQKQKAINILILNTDFQPLTHTR